eukprot:scaffold81816_cov36-Prasinocladus_malaysianus.AAC.1
MEGRTYRQMNGLMKQCEIRLAFFVVITLSGRSETLQSRSDLLATKLACGMNLAVKPPSAQAHASLAPTEKPADPVAGQAGEAGPGGSRMMLDESMFASLTFHTEDCKPREDLPALSASTASQGGSGRSHTESQPESTVTGAVEGEATPSWFY